MNIIKLGDYILNWDEILWVKRIGCGVRIMFKSAITTETQRVNNAVLEIAIVSDEDWDCLIPQTTNQNRGDSDAEH